MSLFADGSNSCCNFDTRWRAEVKILEALNANGVPSASSGRITEESDSRITEEGDTRIPEE